MKYLCTFIAGVDLGLAIADIWQGQYMNAAVYIGMMEVWLVVVFVTSSGPQHGDTK